MARPRKPTTLHLVQGTGRKHRMNPAEPQIAAYTPADVPPPPDHLGEYAAAAWRRLAPVLAGMGLLSPADELAFERLCGCVGEVHAANAALVGYGSDTYATVGTNGQALRRSHPEVAIRADADRRLKGWLSEMGLTPAARSRVSISDSAGIDPLARYFS